MAQSIGAVERKNPLPVGVYYVDVFEDDRAAFYDWIRRYPQVVILRSSTHEPGGWGETGPAYDWVLFRVEDEVPWEGPGFPSIAERGESTTKEDTVQRPPPEKDPIDVIRGAGGSFMGSVLAGGGFTLGALLLYKILGKKR